ncbi:MAG: cytochrome c [Magnetococcales bacterium]|nr:cytochrome c [Magnetococcales bacterium]
MISGMYRKFLVYALLILLPLPTTGWSGDEIVDGKVVYDRECQVCHGTNGMGSDFDWKTPLDGPGLRYPPPPLDYSAHAWHHPDSVLKGLILNGGKDGRMPPFKGKLTEAQMDAVIQFLHSLWKPEQLKWQQEIGQQQPR